MTHTLVLTDVKPSATPSDAEIAAWRDLPRDEQVRRMRQALNSPEAATPSETSMADIWAARVLPDNQQQGIAIP